MNTGEGHSQICVIGAGPVGMTLALLLAKKQISTVLMEARTEMPSVSMAIGITPPSLQIFDELGLADEFLAQGTPVQRVDVFEAGSLCGTLAFDSIPSRTPFVLSLPQVETLNILRAQVQKEPRITFMPGHRFLGMSRHENGVEFQVRAPDRTVVQWAFNFVVAADGVKSAVRKAVGIPQEVKPCSHEFFMADIFGTDDGSAVARLYFDAETSFESFPLPGGARRWVLGAPTCSKRERESRLFQQVSRLTGKDVQTEQVQGSSHFTPGFSLAKPYGSGHVFLAGDAAHETTPIGGQGMNVGIADAKELSTSLANLIQGHSDVAYERERYTTLRTLAFNTASTTGLWGMWLGTRTGRAGSATRKILLTVLLNQYLCPVLARRFSMTQSWAGWSRKPFAYRADLTEIMDDPDSDRQTLENTLSQFTQINRFFTLARKLIVEEIFSNISGDEPIHVVDFGAGGGDLSVWILQEARKRNLNIRVTALDPDVRCTEFMNARYGDVKHLQIVTGGVELLSDLSDIDYLFGNHLLHHLTLQDIVTLLERAGEVVKRGMVFSDLRRSFAGYWMFGVLGRLAFRKSFIVEDGLTSIRRGFQPGELSSVTRGLSHSWSIKETSSPLFRIHFILHKK